MPLSWRKSAARGALSVWSFSRSSRVPQALFVGGCSALATAARVAAAVSRGGAAAIGTSGARSASDVEFCFGGALRADSTHSDGPASQRAACERLSVPEARLRTARAAERPSKQVPLEISCRVSHSDFWPRAVLAAVKVVDRTSRAAQLDF